MITEDVVLFLSVLEALKLPWCLKLVMSTLGVFITIILLPRMGNGSRELAGTRFTVNKLRNFPDVP